MKTDKMRLALLLLMCSTLVVAVEDQKSKENTSEKATETSSETTTKGENVKAETVRIFYLEVLCLDGLDMRYTSCR